MPGESRETRSGLATPVARASSIVGMNRSAKDVDERGPVGTATCIPLPKSGQFASGNIYQQKNDSKLAKTEKNRMRLIMQSNAEQRDDDEADSSADLGDKERRVGIATRDGQPVQRPARTIPRYQPKHSELSRNTDKQVMHHSVAVDGA